MCEQIYMDMHTMCVHTLPFKTFTEVDESLAASTTQPLLPQSQHMENYLHFPAKGIQRANTMMYLANSQICPTYDNGCLTQHHKPAITGCTFE